ncbi:MAG: hypothetical protein U0905_10515 [Pirellulales bacterium]
MNRLHAVPTLSKFSSNATAQFVDQVVQELKKDNPLVLWDALPPKYQQDVEQLLTTASTKLDPGTFRTIRLTRDNLIKVLRTKKSLFVEMFKAEATTRIDGYFQILRSWPGIVGSLFGTRNPNSRSIQIG